MYDEELVVLYNTGNVYYCKRQRFGASSQEANQAHEKMQVLKNDDKNKIIDIANLPSGDIDVLLDRIDVDINTLEEKVALFKNYVGKDITHKYEEYTNALKCLNEMKKGRDEISEIVSTRQKS